MKIISHFSRNYEARLGRNGFFKSQKDIIGQKLKEEGIPFQEGYLWYEDSSLTQIQVPAKTINHEKYTKNVFLQTMGIAQHPQGLLKLLNDLGFVEQKSEEERELHIVPCD